MANTQYRDYDSIKDEAELSEELFLNYSSAQDEWKTGADENEKFVAGVQWTQEQIALLRKRGQGAVTINAITWAIEQLKAMLTANKPSFQAVAREDSDTKKAHVYKSVMSYIWDISDGNSQLKQTIDDYAKMGRGVLYAYVDPYATSGKGEVKFMSLDPRDVYPDPATKDYLWRDAAHILVVTYKTKEQIKQLYPNFDFKGAVPLDTERTNSSPRQAQQQQQFSGEQKDPRVEMYRLIDRLTKKMESVYHVADPFNGEEYEMSEEEYQSYLEKPVVSYSGQIITEDSQVSEVFSMMSRGQTEQMDENTYLYTPEPVQDPETGQMVQPEPVVIGIMTIADVIEQGAIAVREIKVPRVYKCISIGEKKYWSGTLPTEHYPIVPVNNMWNRTPYPISDVTMVRSLQEMINKLNSLIIANAASATNQKVLLPRGAQDKTRLEEELNKAGSTVIEFDAEIGQPVIFGAQAFPNALFHQIELYVNMIERQFGIYALMQGDPGTAPQTFKGTIAMDEFGQRRIKSKKDDIESSLNQLARVTMDFARAVYTEEKIIRLVQPNGQTEEVPLNGLQYDNLGRAIGRFNDINTGRYDVIVISGSTLPSNRFALMEYYMDLYERGLIDQTEVLKKSEVVDAEGVLERFGYIRRMEAQMAEMQEQIKKLQGDLQTAEREEIHAKKRLEVEKFKGELDSIKSNAAASARILQIENKANLRQQFEPQE